MSKLIFNFLCKCKQWNYTHIFSSVYKAPSCSAHSGKILKNMSNFVYVRCADNEDRMQIGLTYPCDHNVGGSVPRAYNLNRSKNEQINVSLERLKVNISKQLNKKNKKYKKSEQQQVSQSQDFDVPISLCIGNEVMSDQMNLDTWIDGAILGICDTKYYVKVNSPTITLLKLPENIMSGFPIFPRIEIEFAHVNDAKYTWFVSEKQDLSDPVSQACGVTSQYVSESGNSAAVESISESESTSRKDTTNSNINTHMDEMVTTDILDQSLGHATEITTSSSRPNKPNQADGTQTPKPINVQNLKWKPISTSHTFIPDNSIVNCYVKLECLPINGTEEGCSSDIISHVTVSPGPGLCPYDTRHLYTDTYTPPNRLRLMTYNILADLYADSDFSRDHLFPHCPPYALHIDYRKQLFLKEIIGYHADLMCLQEVDYKIYLNDIQPGLDTQSIDTVFRMKGGHVNEGLVTAFRKDRFRLIGRHDSVLSDLLTGDESCKSTITDRIAHNSTLSKRLVDRTTAVQVTVLECIGHTGCVVCVANTHLYFHPQASHIRLLQLATCIKHLENVVDSYRQQGHRVHAILCGDLNSTPNQGCVEFITRKRVAPSHGDWRAGGDEEFVAGLSFEHGLSLVNAIQDSRYTNYVGGFSATLDYIFIDSGIFRVTNVIPPPTHEEVTQYTALPSITCPSDHIAQICEVEFISEPVEKT